MSVFASVCSVAGEPADAPAVPAQIPLQALFRDPLFAAVSMSPDGKEVAAVHSLDGVQFLGILPLEGGKVRPLAKAPDPDFRFQRVVWAKDGVLLVSAQMKSPVAVGMRARATRLYAIDRDGKRLRYLAEDWPNADYMQFQDRFLNLLPDDPDEVLLQYWRPGDSAPVAARLNVVNGHLKQYGSRLDNVYEWYADSKGAVRAGEGQIESSSLMLLYARATADGPFDKISEFHFDEDAYEFGGFSEDPNVIYMLSDYELGRDAVYTYSLSEHRILARLYAHEWADVVDLRYASGTDRLVAAIYATDDWEQHWFDAAAEAEQREIDALVPNARNQIVDRSRDGSRVVVRTSTEMQPPVYWAYEHGSKRVLPLFTAYPELAGARFAPMVPVRFDARDRQSIQGYVTMPAGRPPTKLPVIVLLHGGPRTRDVRGWDAEVQLFANRGFGVFQVNYRGSTGWGREFMTQGDKQWGLRMQDDVTDGVKWLIEKGIADPDRIGIYGGSYGGYAAMMGLVQTPELYRCGASYAGVMDLIGMLRDDDWYANGRLIREIVGDPKEDRDRLRATSPIENVARIRVPVLLAHGEDDGTVHVRQTQKMGKALQEAGKEVELMIFPDEIHGFKEERNRIEFYTRLVAFFERNLAPRSSEAASAPAAP